MTQPVLAEASRGGLMPIDVVKQNGLLDRYVSDLGGTGHVAATDRAHPPPTGTWTIDPAESSVSIAWPKRRLGSITGRLHCLGSSTSMRSRLLGSSSSGSHPDCRS